jgi:NAD(P)-dependent dehydrogenase (short-subunit alcohol dehydrogenase family)
MAVDLRDQVAHHRQVEGLGHARHLHPLGDAAHAEEIGTAVFLASEDSAFMSGQTLIVDGGSVFSTL